MSLLHQIGLLDTTEFLQDILQSEKENKAYIPVRGNTNINKQDPYICVYASFVLPLSVHTLSG